MKFGVCAIIKNENLYLRDWVEHYIELGFDKIILYDNNEINGEVPNVVIQDYIDSGYVDIISWKRTFKNFNDYLVAQISSYNNCLKKYKNILDWIAFLDIDEFLELEKHKKIQYLFNDAVIYNDYNVIIMSWYTMGNNKTLYYENKCVKEIFIKHVTGEYGGLENIDMFCKSFVKVSSNVVFEKNPHCPVTNNICNVYGVKIENVDEQKISALMFPNHNIMYVKHYYTKSLIEFLYKSFNKTLQTVNRSIDIYKNMNGWSEEHEKVYQNFLKQNNIKQ